MILNFPALLPWLALAVLPWILHLFLFRKARVIYFPSLFFLKRCTGWSNRLKLQRVLLLLTRTALILYFVLSIIDPQVESGASSAQSSPALIVLDDRPAMRMKLLARPESFFDVCRQAAIDELERRPYDSILGVRLLSELALLDAARMPSPAQAMTHLRAASPHPLTVPAEKYLQDALDRIPADAHLVFFSPFQLDLRRSTLVRRGPSAPPEPNHTLLSLKSPASSVSGSPISVSAHVVDAYGQPADAMVKLRVGDRDAAVARAEQGVATFLIGDLAKGRNVLTAQLVRNGSDGYPDDDERMAQVEVRPGRNVGFAAQRMPSPLSAALRALGVGNAEDLQVSPEGNWSGWRRIVAMDLSRPDDLAGFLDEGGEVIIFSDAWRSGHSILNLRPTPVAVPAFMDATAFQDIWNAPTPADRIPASRQLRLTRNIHMDLHPADRVMGSFADGSWAAVRRQVGKGSVVLVAFSIDDPMLQVDPAYLLMVRGILSAGTPDPQDLQAPDEKFFEEIPLAHRSAIRIGPGAPVGQVSLVGAAHSIPMTLGYAQGAFYAELPSSPHPAGMYRLLIGSAERGRVHLVPAPPPPLAMAAAVPVPLRASMGSFFFWIAVLLMAVELLLLRQSRSWKF